MRLPDDEINERLRRALTDKFSSTKEQPDPELANIVLNSIHRRKRSTMPYRLLLTAILVFLTTMRPEKRLIPLPVKPQIAHTGKLAKAKEITYSTEKKNITNTSVTPPHSPKEKNIAAQKQDSLKPKSTALIPDDAESQLEKIATNEVLIRQNIDSVNVALLNNSGYILLNALELPAVTAPKRSHITEKPKEVWHLLFEFTPMNTYQVVRIRNNQPIQYQNFKFPESFSNKKIAYQFQTGVERNGLQLHFGYAFSRQNFQYEIATDEFVLDKQNQVVRKGVSEKVDNSLHFGNIGISKEVSFNKAKFRGYFIRVGADLSREFTTRQNVLWGTAAFGKTIPLGAGSVLNVGPYIEYSLNKMQSREAGFMLQPYQAGLSIQLKYKLKPNR